MALKIVRNDITKMNTEAIVNTANANPTVGSGCDYAVYKAAGCEKLLAYRKENIGYVPEGAAFLTPGFALQAKYIIHAVSPLYKGGKDGEEEKLRCCYRESLRIAKENQIKSLAFPLIATGSFGYPKEEGLRIAVDEIHAFLLRHEMEIYLVVFDDRATSMGGKIDPKLEAYIDQNYVEEKCEEEYEDAFSKTQLPPRKDTTDFSSGGRQTQSFRKRSGKIRGKESAEFCAGAANMASAAMPAAPKASMFGSVFKKNSRDSEPQMRESVAMSSVMEDKPLLPEFDLEHESRLEERMSHISDTFSQYLLYLIRNKKMENAEVYKRAIVDKKTFSKIKNNVDYHPQKLTALCLCVGAKLNLDESKDLLARAGYALSPCDKTDIIFSYFIENEIYDMIELDIQLEEHGLACIIS